MALTPAHPGVVHVDGKRYLLNPNEWAASDIEELRAPAQRRQWWQIAPRRSSRFPPASLREPRAMELHWLEGSGISADDSSDWNTLWLLTRHLDVLGETYERVAAASDGIPFDDKLETVPEAEAALRADLEQLDKLVAAARVTFDAAVFRERWGIR